MSVRCSPPGRRLTSLLARCARGLPRLLTAAATLAGLGLPAARAATWDHAHGDATNSGFADVATAPALHPLATVPGIGTYAPGAGPVIGPDGTVYLGSQQGDLRALHPDGSLYWKRNLGPPSQQILAAPTVDTDGSIYVVGVRSVTDHRVTPAVRRSEARLYRFEPNGALRWVALFPSHYPSVPAAAGNGVTTAPANIWRSGAEAAVLVPAMYLGLVSKDIRLLAFSTGGALLADRLVGAVESQLFSSSFSLPGLQFCARAAPPRDPADRLPDGIAPPMPGVAIFIFQGGGTPWIVATDQAGTVAGWTFSVGGGFKEWFRTTLAGAWETSAPLVVPDGHSVVGATEWGLDECGNLGPLRGRVKFGGPNGVALSDVDANGGEVGPARTADGRIVVAHDYALEVLRGSTKLQEVGYPGQTIAPAAVSRTHIYVSTAGSLRTYDANTLAKVGELDWFGGGRSTPAIGLSGRVYALASDVLFIWPGPVCSGSGCITAPPAGVVNARH